MQFTSPSDARGLITEQRSGGTVDGNSAEHLSPFDVFSNMRIIKITLTGIYQRIIIPPLYLRAAA